MPVIISNLNLYKETLADLALSLFGGACKTQVAQFVVHCLFRSFEVTLTNGDLPHWNTVFFFTTLVVLQLNYKSLTFPGFISLCFVCQLFSRQHWSKEPLFFKPLSLSVTWVHVAERWPVARFFFFFFLFSSKTHSLPCVALYFYIISK